MDILFFLVGGIGFIISIIFLFINVIRKKKTKKPLINAGLCIILFIISLSMPNGTATQDKKIEGKAAESKQVNKEKVSQEDLNNNLKKEAIKAEFTVLNGHNAEKADLKVFAEGEISAVDYNKVMDVFPSFLLSQKEGDGYGMYHISNLLDIKGLKNGDNVKVYGTVDKELSKDGIIKINATIIENLNDNAENKIEVTSKKEGTEVTYENFLKLGMDQTYEDACALLGEGTESSSSEIGGITTKMYSWKGNGLANMNITIQNGVVTGKAQMGLNKNNPGITLEKYNSVNEGMTLEEVISVLGQGDLTSQSKLMDIESYIYSWINKNGANCNITFQDGVVVMKSQFGLQ